MRICMAYDCLYPWTIGGYERYLRALAEAVAAAGHDVTYLTRLQWGAADPPCIPGVRVVAVSGRDKLYGSDGNRLIGPPLRFGRGVLGHLLRHRTDYDVVHLCAFPYFSLLAAGLVGVSPLFVDWPEVWSAGYWRGYLGGARGVAGWGIQRVCVRVPQQAFTLSELHGDRLRAEGLRGAPIRLAGLYSGPLQTSPVVIEREPLVVFAGRHIAEKRVPAIPPAIALARVEIPNLKALILGDGPEHAAVVRAIEAHGVADCVAAPGFVASEVVAENVALAACLLLPSAREGYGLVVIEAAASGTPSVVVAGEDNAAVERIVPGVNGFVAASDSPRDLADAIVDAVGAGSALRASTAAWFAHNAESLSVARTSRLVLQAYEDAVRRRSSGAHP